jgi:hypothetical protein
VLIQWRSLLLAAPKYTDAGPRHFRYSLVSEVCGLGKRCIEGQSQRGLMMQEDEFFSRSVAGVGAEL